MISEIAKVNPKAKYFGIDIYDKAISYAKKHYPNIKFLQAPANKLPFKKHSFDLILSYETIEHLDNPKAFLQETIRILKPGGIFILAMDSGNLLFRLVWFFWEGTISRVWQGAHLTAFHHSELVKLSKSAGFKIRAKIFTHLGMEVVLVLK